MAFRISEHLTSSCSTLWMVPGAPGCIMRTAQWLGKAAVPCHALWAPVALECKDWERQQVLLQVSLDREGAALET